MYDIAGSYVRQIAPQYANGNRNTKGIALDSLGKVYIGGCVSNEIVIHNFSDGKFESSISVDLRSSNYLTISSENSIIITADVNTYDARVINTEGQILHKLRPPKDVTQSWCPTGVCTVGKEDEEEIFICNRAGKPGVYRFLPKTGNYLGCVTTNVTCPHGIAFTEDGRLIVADKTCVKVFAPVE